MQSARPGSQALTSREAAETAIEYLPGFAKADILSEHAAITAAAEAPGVPELELSYEQALK